MKYFHPYSSCRSIVGAFAIFLLTFGCQVVTAKGAFYLESVPSHSYVAERVAEIKSEKSSLSRTQHAEDLANWINGENLHQVDKQDIDELADMLNDSDDSVSFWIAIALGHIGPRAASAIPLLQERLDYVSCIRVNGVAPEFTSAQAIRFAFEKIGAHPKAVVCK
jgi:hypothetical protein